MQLSSVMPPLQCQPIGASGLSVIEPHAPLAAADATLEFGRFRVHTRQRRLFADGVPIDLGTRAFETLMVLIEADGSLVTKDEILSRVWPGIVVGQDNLKVQISALRKALGEDGDLIRTEFGRGYRFTAAIRSAAVDASHPAVASDPTASIDLVEITSRLMRLEVKLAEALNLLATHPPQNRARRRRYAVGSSGRRTHRRSVGYLSRGRDAPGKVIDRAG